MKFWQKALFGLATTTVAIVLLIVGIFVYEMNRPIVRVDIPWPKTIEESSTVSFVLPKGDYIFMAQPDVFNELPSDDLPPFEWEYRIEVPSQNLIIAEKAKISFFDWMARATLHLEKLKIEKNNTTCQVTLKINKPNKSGIKIHFYVIEAILFRTVE